MIARLVGDLPRRTLVLTALLLILALVMPILVGDYLLTVLILTLYFAYTGQAWNIMMGFAGQLSLGHALFVGLGAYTTATLFVYYGVPPWIGFFAAVIVSVACGALMGFLAFRFRVAGVYFAILTIAFAEFARTGFDNWSFVGGAAGLFLPVSQYSYNDLWRLRGHPAMFYYVMLTATIVVFIASRIILKSRLGYYCLAVREDEQAARACGINTFRYKMYAVMISAGMTSFGGVFYAFFYNNLFPEQIFNISRSIEIILAPLVGGVGTLGGPIFGAFVLQGLAESLHFVLTAFGIDIPGVKHIFFGFVLLLVVLVLPEGMWPWISRRLGLSERGR